MSGMIFRGWEWFEISTEFSDLEWLGGDHWSHTRPMQFSANK